MQQKLFISENNLQNGCFMKKNVLYCATITGDEE